MSGGPREEGGLPLAASLLQTDNSVATATGDTPEDQVAEHAFFSLFICLLFLLCVRAAFIIFKLL